MKHKAGDPFLEFVRPSQVRELRLLGAVFRFTVDDRRLLALLDAAFSELPPIRLTGRAPRLEIRLRLMPGVKFKSAPPPASYSSGAGLLSGIVDATNFAIVDPAGRRAVVSISEAMLRSPYHARYELIEFAALTLAARVQGLVPLHGACLAWRGRGVLLLGASGSGKSTLSLHGLLDGLELLSEDSVFVLADELRAVGLANYLHLRPASLSLLRSTAGADAIRASPSIRRRSGVRKFELDVRRSGLRMAQRAPRIEALVFVSARRARGGARLQPIEPERMESRLRRDQPYAAGQPGWRRFVSQVCRRGFELRRGTHPEQSVRLLRALLERDRL